MNRFNEIFIGVLLGSVLAITTNIISNWIWEHLFKKPLNKIIGFSLIIIVFILVMAVVITQYDASPLPSGIERQSLDLRAAWNNKGFVFYKQANYSYALYCYEKAIEIDPEYILAWSNKGNALKALNRNIEAEIAFARARGHSND